MMNYQLLIILFISILIFSCGEKKDNAVIETNLFTIEGEIKGLESHLYYRHPDKEYSRENQSDSILVENGKFTYTDSISELSIFRAFTKFSPDSKLFKIPADGKGYFPVKSSYLMFFAFPGAEVKVSGKATDFIDAYPSGDDYNNSLAAINKIAYPIYNESVNLLVKSTFEKDSVDIKKYESMANSVGEKGIKERIAHVQAHPKSLGALWYLEDLMLRTQIEDSLAIEIFNNISPGLKDNKFYKAVELRVNGIRNSKEGAQVPSIKTTATLDGKEFDISSYRGKYVLIDFWGIWCGPCVKEMPEVKAFQEKHKDKLVVLGINSGDKKEKIQKFIEEKGYDWQQLMSARKNTTDNFVNRFNVQGFPTKLIIDPNGKIVKRYVGGGEEAFDHLERLLN